MLIYQKLTVSINIPSSIDSLILMQSRAPSLQSLLVPQYLSFDYFFPFTLMSMMKIGKRSDSTSSPRGLVSFTYHHLSKYAEPQPPPHSHQLALQMVVHSALNPWAGRSLKLSCIFTSSEVAPLYLGLQFYLVLQELLSTAVGYRFCVSYYHNYNEGCVWNGCGFRLAYARWGLRTWGDGRLKTIEKLKRPEASSPKPSNIFCLTFYFSMPRL